MGLSIILHNFQYLQTLLFSSFWQHQISLQISIQISSAPSIIALPVGKIVGVKFSMVTPEFMTKEATEIKPNTQSDYSSPLDSNTLGAVFLSDQCDRCKGKGDTKTPCPGHPGWIKLQDEQRFLHPALLTSLQRFLSVFCPFCGQFKMKVYYQKIGIEDEQSQLKELEKLRLETPMFKFLDNIYDLCGQIPCTCNQKQIKYQVSQQDDKIYRIIKGAQNIVEKQEVTVDQLLDLFKDKIEKNNKEEMKILKINPSGFIITKIPVMAKPARPATEMFGIVSRHMMTDRYQQILNAVANNEQDIESLYAPIVQQDKTINELGGHSFKSIPLQLKGKQGLMRMNIMGKRVNYCARSVIGGDPTIGVNELGVPMSVAKTVTVREFVTDTNKDRLQQLVDNGQNYPGAASIEIPGQGVIKNDKHIDLKTGYIVNRHLLNGDPVMFNRQPTLHKMSFMSHRAKILPYCTFRMNLSACKPYNADFDGDEMNFHVPQSYLAQSELMNIMSVDKQILTCKNGGPLISITQDAQIGGWVLTRKDTQIDLNLYQDMTMWGDSTNRKIYGFSQPAVLYPKPVYTGKQMISLILPKGINFDKTDKKDNETYADNYFQDKSVKILNGELLCGYSSGITVAKPGLLLHKIFKDYGSDACKDFLNSCQRITTYFMQNRGFTIGLSDMIQSQQTLDKVQHSFDKLQKEYKELLVQSIHQKIKLAPGQTHQQAYEGAIVNRIQSCRDECQDIAIKGLDHRNCLYRLVTSGSKGGPLNIMQISASVGQQLLTGQRMFYRYQSQRGLPHFMSQQFGLTERGFVQHSFIKGLTLQEFYYHMVGGREGVCDTAIKTADSGYVERKLMKNMESVKLCYDGTVRNAANEIVQLAYGDDGTDTHKVETMKAADLLHKPYKTFFDNTYINYQQIQQGGRQRMSRQLNKATEEVNIQELIDLLVDNSPINQQFSPVIDVNSNKQYLKEKLLEVANLVKKSEYQPKANQTINSQLNSAISSEQLNLYITEFLTLVLEHIQLQQYDIFLQQYSQNTSNLENNLSLPMNLKRYFDDAKISSQINKNSNTEKLTPEYIIDKVNNTVKFIKEINQNNTMQFIIAFRYQFCVKQVLKAQLGKQQFDLCLQQIQDKFLHSNAPAGEAVGPLAAHSISEPATQLTLNTFHVAGTSALGQLGLPRLKELINFTNSKIPVMTIRLKQDKVQTVEQQKQTYMKVSSLLENKYFGNLIQEEKIEYVGQNQKFDNESLYDQFNSLLQFDPKPSEQDSPLQLVYILSPQQLYEIEETKNIQNIVQIIRESIDNYLGYDEDDEEQQKDVHIEYNPGFGQQVIKIRITKFTTEQYLQLSENLKQIHIQGIDTIKKVLKNSNNYPKLYEQEDKPKLNGGIFGADSAAFVYKEMLNIDDSKTNKQQNYGSIIINTEGSSLLDVFSIPDVDFEHTITNDVPEVYDVLGIEAARSVLLYVMKTVLEGPNLRHFMLLTDVMLQKPYKHKLISINRNGQHITNTSVLAQASFEQPGRTLLDAAVLNLEDNLQSVSANVVMGTEAKHGTGSFDLVVDTNALPQKAEKQIDMIQQQELKRDSEYDNTQGMESGYTVQNTSQFSQSMGSSSVSKSSFGAMSSVSAVQSHYSQSVSQNSNASNQSSARSFSQSIRNSSSQLSGKGLSNNSISISVASSVMSQNRSINLQQDESQSNQSDQGNNEDWF